MSQGRVIEETAPSLLASGIKQARPSNKTSKIVFFIERHSPPLLMVADLDYKEYIIKIHGVQVHLRVCPLKVIVAVGANLAFAV
jgi:hypothetical protein